MKKRGEGSKARARLENKTFGWETSSNSRTLRSKDKILQIGECGDYWSLSIDEDGFNCIVQFNHPSAMAFKKADEEYQFISRVLSSPVRRRQMRWEVKKVVLMDGENNECNPFNVPDGFWPTATAIHLGKRLG